MGTRGPKSAPTHLKVLKGTEERYINREEPSPSEDEVTKPEMSEEAGKIWDELAPDLIDKKCLTAWDTHTFAVFCEATAAYHENRKLLGKKYTALGAAGGVIKSPHWQIMRDAAETMAKYSGRFGLTPGDRANLKIERGDSGPSHGAERILG